MADNDYMRIRCTFKTRAAPEDVFTAYTDFSQRRLETWRDTLRPENYELRELGHSYAVVREGRRSRGMVLRYEWSPAHPNFVRWRMVRSEFCQRGDGEVEIRPAGASGSQVTVRIEEHGAKGLRNRLLLVVKGLLGPFVLGRATRRSLDRLARG